eukprot:14679030-Alexandrium_andersonii.AAC.1
MSVARNAAAGGAPRERAPPCSSRPSPEGRPRRAPRKCEWWRDRLARCRGTCSRPGGGTPVRSRH